MTQDNLWMLWLTILLICALTMGYWAGIRIDRFRAHQRWLDFLHANPEVAKMIDDLPRIRTQKGWRQH